MVRPLCIEALLGSSEQPSLRSCIRRADDLISAVQLCYALVNGIHLRLRPHPRWGRLRNGHNVLTLLTWVMRKFKRFRDHKVRAGRFLERLARENAGFRFMVTLRTEKRRRLRRPSFGRNLPVARLVPGTAIEPGDTSPAHAAPSSSFVRSLISPRLFSDALGQRPLARRAHHLSLGH
jgi:hypothetical protein